MKNVKNTIIFSLIAVVSAANLLIPVSIQAAQFCNYLIAAQCPSGSTNTSYTSTAGNHSPVWSYTGDRTLYAEQVLNLTIVATDADHDFLYYDALNLPAGAYFEPTSHTLYWKPSQNQIGNHYIQFSVTDNNTTIYQTVNVIVLNNGNGNRKPVWNSIGDKDITAGQFLQFGVSATDPDGNSIVYSALNIPSGASFDSSNRTFYWTPGQNQTGTYVVTFRAYDGTDNSDLGVTIRVNSGFSNPAPQFNNPPRFFGFNPGTTAVVNQLYTYDSNATDPDGDTLIYSLASAPSGMSINTASGFLAWVPVSSQIGTSVVRVAVSDGRNQATADFSITVFAAGSPAPVTPAPVAPSEAKIVISEIKIENIDQEIVVSWKTNIPSGSRVIYDTASQADRTRGFTYANATRDERELVTSHSVNLGKLETNLVYYLRVVSKTDLQTVASQEIGFIQLEGGEIRGLFGASLIDILGDLFGNSAFLWILISVLGLISFSFYRKQKKGTTVI